MTSVTIDPSFAGEGLYREHILDHYKHPRHFGEWKSCSVQHNELNPVCGDQLSFQLKIDDKGKVTDVHFSGSGCAISIASASLLSDEIIGKSLLQLVKMKKEVVEDLLGIPLGPVRLKCALLSLDTIKKACVMYTASNKGGQKNG